MKHITYIERTVDPDIETSLKAVGYHDIVARVAAARLTEKIDPRAMLKPTLSDLDDPFSLKDIDKAADRIKQAIVLGETVGLVVDHDSDGIASASVLHEAFTKYFGHPEDRCVVLTTHRLTEGYGLSDAVVDRIMANDKRPDLVITADQGSSDEARIRRLKDEFGVPCIITDHHTIPDNDPPRSAYAFINPQQADCTYPDSHVAGGFVAFLLAWAVRQKLNDDGAHIPSLIKLLDFAGMACLADCVSLGKSRNNRIAINYMLRCMNQGTRPCWRALNEYNRQPTVTSETVAFLYAPALAAKGRLDESMSGVRFLLSDTDEDAESLCKVLMRENEVRKTIERGVTERMMKKAEEQASYQLGLVLYSDENFAGTQGINASRLGEKFGMPTMVLSPVINQPDQITGSCRSILPEFDMKQALDYVNTHYPGLLIRAGGHRAAAGCLSHKDDASLEILNDAFNEACGQQIGFEAIGPRVLHDGPIDRKAISLSLIDKLTEIEPFGRGFEYPLFYCDLTIQMMRPVGEAQDHVKFDFKNGRSPLAGIWFFGAHACKALTLATGQTRRFVFALQQNSFQGKTSVQINITGVITP